MRPKNKLNNNLSDKALVYGACTGTWGISFVIKRTVSPIFEISQKFTLPHALYFDAVVLHGFSRQKLVRLVFGAEREIQRTLELLGLEPHEGGFRDDVVAEGRGERQKFVHGGRPRETAAIDRPLDDVAEQAPVGRGRRDFRFASDLYARVVYFHDAVVGGVPDGGRDHVRVPGDGLQHFERQQHGDRHPAVVEPDSGLQELVVRQIGVAEIELELLDDSRIAGRHCTAAGEKQIYTRQSRVESSHSVTTALVVSDVC